jgi:hypothetical protein
MTLLKCLLNPNVALKHDWLILKLKHYNLRFTNQRKITFCPILPTRVSHIFWTALRPLSQIKKFCRLQRWKIILLKKLAFNIQIKSELMFKYRLEQARATSGPRATYGPPSIFMWPASYILSFLNSYIDYEKNIKHQENICFIVKTTSKLVYMDMYWPADV